MKIKKIKASGAIEFLTTFIILFVFFVSILDIGLFFREVYFLQAVSDEVLARLEIERTCSDVDPSNLISANLRIYYNRPVNLTRTTINSNTYAFKDDNFTASLICRTDKVPDSLILGYKYKGLFVYKRGKTIYSNMSTNTTYF